MEEAQRRKAPTPTEHSNVREMFAHPVSPHREPLLTYAELAEYRRIKPIILQMLAEWAILKSEQGCPVARSLLIK